MEKPTKCQWCGCGDIQSKDQFAHSVWMTFACGSMCDVQLGDTRWLRSARCAGQVGQMYRRIQRAIEALRSAERYTAIGEESVVDWQRNPRGPVADAGAIERAISILEGVSDGE